MQADGYGGWYLELGAVHKVGLRHAILDHFDPLPLSHFVTQLGTPLKYVTLWKPPPPKITKS